MVFKTNLILSFFQNSYYLSWWQLCTHLSHSLNQLHNGDDGMLFKQSLISLICWVFLATFSFSLCFKSSKPIKMSCPIRFEQTLCKSVFYSSEMNIQTRKCSMQSKANKQTNKQNSPICIRLPNLSCMWILFWYYLYHMHLYLT